MSRLSPYLGIVAALVLGALLVAFSGDVTTLPVTRPAVSIASSTVTLLPELVLPPIFDTPEAASTTPSEAVEPVAAATSSVPKQVVSPAPKPTHAPEPAPVVTAQTPVPAPPDPVATNAALDASAAVLRAALVNIICYVPYGSGLHSISGSGVFIDSKGIILTNAHVAQYFLLSDKGVDCVIRSGSPAVNNYEAALLYIPAAWITANATVLTQLNPTGTGENDFALLGVTRAAPRRTLPEAFPSIPLSKTPPHTGAAVVIASYGAQFLESSQIQSSLFPTVVFGIVQDVFTFGTNTIDVLALGGSVAAQEGSSGGGVADASGELVGTITTSTTEGDTNTRSLDAITASYIRAAYASATGEALDLLLGNQVADSVAAFAPRIPALESILTAQLP